MIMNNFNCSYDLPFCIVVCVLEVQDGVPKSFGAIQNKKQGYQSLNRSDVVEDGQQIVHIIKTENF